MQDVVSCGRANVDGIELPRDGRAGTLRPARPMAGHAAIRGRHHAASERDRGSSSRLSRPHPRRAPRPPTSTSPAGRSPETMPRSSRRPSRRRPASRVRPLRRRVWRGVRRRWSLSRGLPHDCSTIGLQACEVSGFAGSSPRGDEEQGRCDVTMKFLAAERLPRLLLHVEGSVAAASGEGSLG